MRFNNFHVIKGVRVLALTLADLKNLPRETQALLLLARLAAISPQGRSAGGLNKGNLSLPNDPYGLATGYSAQDKSEIRQYLLGAPWTHLVNEGYLVDPAGNGFYNISGEGYEALQKASWLSHGATSGSSGSPPKTGTAGWRLRTAVVLNVLIASPSDVGQERDVVASAVHAWNAAHYSTTGIMLNPIRWETHSFPASGDRPQAIINRQIVDEGDLLIGIFGTRLGTPTGEAQSGTIEEIERFRKAGKYVALYFSTADVPRNVDRDQLKALEEYQRERQKDTLFATFTDADHLRQLVSQHLPKIVAEVYGGLQESHQLDHLAEELQVTEDRSNQRLQELAVQMRPRLSITTDFVGEYPDGPRLHVTANRNIMVTQVDYLDERNVRIASERVEVGGMDFEIPIQYGELVKINNMKPRTGSETIPISLRVHIVDGEEMTTHTIPVALQPAFKPIRNTPTLFFKLLG